MRWGRLPKVISIVLVLALTMSACSRKNKNEKKSSQQNSIIDEEIYDEEHLSEDTITEDTFSEEEINETVLNEFITEEIYLEEVVVAEEEITEQLLSEEDINEVELCKSIYVPEDSLDTFSENSKTGQLFGDDVDVSSLLKKITVGTGVIVTIVVLKHAHFPNPLASVIFGAADKSMKFSKSGAALGSLYGALSGGADEIDKTGRLSSVLAFATATVCLVLSVVNLALLAHSGGATGPVGIKLFLSAVFVIDALGKTVESGYECIKTLDSIDAEDIDWDGIDWKKVGISAAEQAIEDAGNGYLWGSIVGAVYGGAEGYEYFEKFHAPYSDFETRRKYTPSKKSDVGHWKGKRGNSDFILDEPLKLKDGTVVKKITYKDGIPDFSPYKEAQIKIPDMTNNRSYNFSQADEFLAAYWDRIQYKGKGWTARDVSSYRKTNGLTWHEMNNMQYMQLVPNEVNSTFSHLGGVGEYNIMTGQDGQNDNWG